MFFIALHDVDGHEHPLRGDQIAGHEPEGAGSRVLVAGRWLSVRESEADIEALLTRGVELTGRGLDGAVVRVDQPAAVEEGA